MNRSKILPAVLAVALLATLAGSAAAQRVSFSIGGGYHGHHRHHHHHPSWSFGFYSPPPRVTYVYPAPVIREQVYVYPQQTILQQPVTAAPAPAPAAPTSNWAGRPEPKANALPASQKTNSWVIIRNPADSGGPVAFLLDEDTDVRLEAGQSRSLAGGPRTVEFDRGGDFGTARKTLGEGTYEFVVTASGWDLVNKTSLDRTATKSSALKNALPR